MTDTPGSGTTAAAPEPDDGPYTAGDPPLGPVKWTFDPSAMGPIRMGSSVGESIALEPAPTPTPPGTSAPTFWERGATKQALSITVGALVLLGGTYISTDALPSRDVLGVVYGALVWAWAGAFGIAKTDADELRWR